MKVLKKFLKVLKVFLLIMVPFIVLAIIGFIWIINSTLEITDTNFWVNTASSSLVYDRDGNVITKLSLKDTMWIELVDEEGEALVSNYYLNALIATEDQNFYNHSGINIKGMLRAVFGHLVGDSGAGGGSSITMQLAKLLYLTPEETSYYNIVDEEGNIIDDKYYISYENPIMYKLTQMILALKIEHSYSKEEILENYVNTMYFGHGNYGIYNASKYYYGVEPKDLTLAQSAMLAGLTQAPSTWDPYENPEDAKARRDIVLSLMLEQEYITQEEYDAAINTEINTDLVEHETNISSNIYEGVLDQIFKELNAEFGSSIDISTAGMTIHTTIDSDIQKDIYEVQKAADGEYVNYPDEYLQSGVVVLDAQNGKILGIGDNRFTDESGRQNYGINLSRSPGSSCKPIVDYAAAIEFLGWSSAHIVVDQPISYSDGTSLKNFEGGYKGSMYLTDALSNSRNTTALYAFQQVENKIGNTEYLKWFNSLGLTEPTTGILYESAAIGGYMTNPLQMSGAYATLANGGTYNEPHIIEYIEFSEASPYYDEYGAKYEMPYDSWKVMEPSSAYITTMMLDPSQPMALTSSADVDGMDLAIKSGTSNFGDNSIGIPAESIRDRWIMGYSANVVTGVWTGYPSYAEKNGYYYYTTLDHVPEQIFHQIMTKINAIDKDYLHDDEFSMPDNVVEQTLNGRTFYGVKDSEDVEKYTNIPKVTITSKSGSLNISWTIGDDIVSSQIYIDGKLHKTFTDNTTTLSIPFTDLYEIYGCKDSFTVKVETTYNGYTLESSEKSLSIDNPTCQEKTDETDGTGETTEPETDGTGETTETT